MSVTIVMYHYVRPIADSPYPGIKGLEIEGFKNQLDFLASHYHLISMSDLTAALASDPDALPKDAALLTFDDGYLDHFEHVLPVLAERKLSGAFYPVADVVFERRLLNVNKIHYVLASGADPDMLVARIECAVEAARPRFALDALDAYRERHHGAFRWDPGAVMYVKRMLQFALPEELRHEIANALFAEFVSADEGDFAERLYLGVAELRAMNDAGMHIGSHGASHTWLSRLSRVEQASEIERSLKLFDAIGAPRDGFTFCYPFGDYNADTVELLAERGCAAAVTTHFGVAEIGAVDRLALPRLDTNEFPVTPLDAPLTCRAGA